VTLRKSPPTPPDSGEQREDQGEDPQEDCSSHLLQVRLLELRRQLLVARLRGRQMVAARRRRLDRGLSRLRRRLRRCL